MESLLGSEIWLWIGFTIFVLLLLALDLFVFHRNPKEVSVKEALWLSAFWIGLAIIFNGLIFYWKGPETGLEFASGYLIEKALSLDNVVIFVMLFAYFQVPVIYQHRVLFWGVVGALIMRAILILIGTALVQNFDWISYLFGVFLILTGVKMGMQNPEKAIEPEKNPAIRLVKKLLPVSDRYHDAKFFIKENGSLIATPLFLVLVMVEFTDLIFALDSVPAIFAITDDPFIVYTSNVFAMLGLRSLYFALAGIITQFRYLQLGLSILLVFVGGKMIAAQIYGKLPVMYSLSAIAFILGTSIIASIWADRRDRMKGERPKV